MNAIKRGMPAIHPGLIIKHEYMDAFELTQEQFAKLIGMSRRNANFMLNGKLPISAETAVRLAAIFKTSAQFWLNLQTMYDIDQARNNEKVAKAVKVLVKYFKEQPRLEVEETVNVSGEEVQVSSFKGVRAPENRRRDDVMRKLVDDLSKIDGKASPGRKKKGK